MWHNNNKVTLHQAVSAAQRELSGCEERSEETGDTDPGDIGEDEAARWPLRVTRGTRGDQGVTSALMGITATLCFLFNLSFCELYKFDSWPPEKVSELGQEAGFASCRAPSSEARKTLSGSPGQGEGQCQKKRHDIGKHANCLYRNQDSRKWQMSWFWVIILKVDKP